MRVYRISAEIQNRHCRGILIEAALDLLAIIIIHLVYYLVKFGTTLPPGWFLITTATMLIIATFAIGVFFHAEGRRLARIRIFLTSRTIAFKGGGKPAVFISREDVTAFHPIRGVLELYDGTEYRLRNMGLRPEAIDEACDFISKLVPSFHEVAL